MNVKNIMGLSDEEYKAYKEMGFIVDLDFAQLHRLGKLMDQGMSIEDIAKHDAEMAFKKMKKDKK